MTLLNTANAIRLGSQTVSRAYVGGTQVWPPVKLSYRDTVLADGPVAMWAFDGAGVTEADLVAGRVGTFSSGGGVGATPWSNRQQPSLLPSGEGLSTGWTNAAQSRFWVPTPPAVGAGNFTFESWIFLPTGGVGTTNYGGFICSTTAIGTAQGNQFTFQWGTAAANIQIGVGGAQFPGGGGASGMEIAMTGGAFPTNTPIYFVWTVEGQTVRFYRNGTLTQTLAPFTTRGAANGANWIIGGIQGGAFRPLDHRQQFTAIYNQAIDQATITRHWQAAQ